MAKSQSTRQTYWNRIAIVFEIDTEDIVMGFAKTMKTTTRNVQKAINMIKKVCNDCGTFISPSVRIVSVRMYQNNELVKSLNA